MLSPMPMAVTAPYADIAQVSYYDATSTGVPGSDPFGDAVSYWNDIIETTVRKLSRRLVRTTSGFDTELRIYAPTLPSNERITDRAEAFIHTLPETKQTQLALALLKKICSAVFENNDYRELVPFAQIAATKLDDGTLLLEWVYKYGRVNFFIDEVVEESSAVFLDGSYGTDVPLVYETTFNGGSVTNLARQSSDFVARFA